MKIFTMFAAAAVVAVLAGCASVETAGKLSLNGQKLTLSNQVQDVAHINGSNWGIYFLKWGLFSGSTEEIGSIAVLQDTVRLDKTVAMVTAKSKAIGGQRTVDMQSRVSSFMLPLPIPFLFYFRQVEVSANSVKAMKR